MPDQTPPPNKVVSRNVAIGLGIICVILVAGLGGALGYYVTNYSHTNSDYNSLSTQNTNLQNQVNADNTIISLSNSTIWVNDQTVEQGAGSFNTWTETANYAGYVVVSVLSSTVSGTHVEVIYSAYGASFDQTQVVSAGYTAVFPLLPCSDITVGVGNGNILSSATETVTITYYY
jgi:hypothetical protein